MITEELSYITNTMESTTRTTKTTTSTSNKTFNALTTETTRILGYLYSNFAKQTTKSCDYLCNGATQQSVLAFLILWRISCISSITDFVYFIDPQNSVLG